VQLVSLLSFPQAKLPWQKLESQNKPSPPPHTILTNHFLPFTEGDYNRADASLNRDESAIGSTFSRGVNDVENAPRDAERDVQQDFDNGVQDAENVPSDIGSGIDKAASWIGDKFGGAEREGRDAEGDVEGAGRRVEGDYGRAEGDVEGFGQGVGSAYDQGEQRGEQQGF